MTAPADLPAVLQAAAPLVTHYGYWAVAALVMIEDFGIPLPGETTLLAAAFFASTGRLNIMAVFIVALLAAVLGNCIGYAIGAYGGRPLVEHFGKYVFLSPSRLKKAEAYFNAHGGGVVIVARFIEGLRQLNGIIAGISTMTWRRFVLFNSLGAVLWVACWSAIGYFGGHYIVKFTDLGVLITVVVIIAAIGYGVIYFLRRKRDRQLS
jgi:membrane protein DedA with SNARE-associated domain